MGWIALLALLTGMYLMLHFKVQAVHSDVVRAERRIVSLEQEKLLLATEFETRANQMQLAAWNQVDFGYVAPTAAQFLDGERQLASLGAPALLPGSSPIRLAQATAIEDLAAGSDLDEDEVGADAGRVFAVADIRQDSRDVRLATATLASSNMATATLASAVDRVPLAALAGAAAE
jgi:hypothetical protein